MFNHGVQYVTKMVRQKTNEHFEQWEKDHLDLDTLQDVATNTLGERQDIMKRRHDFTILFDQHGQLVIECQGAKWMLPAAFAMQTSLAVRKYLTEQVKTPYTETTITLHDKHPYLVDCMVRHWKDQSREFDKDWSIRDAIILSTDLSLHNVDKSKGSMKLYAELYDFAHFMEDQSFMNMIMAKLRHRLLNVPYDYSELLGCLKLLYESTNQTPAVVQLKKIFLTGTIIQLTQLERSPDAPELTKMKEVAAIKDDLEEGIKYCIWKLSVQK